MAAQIGDNSAVNDVMIKCEDNNIVTQNSGLVTDGVWNDWKMCPTGAFVRGVRQQVQRYLANQGNPDDTGLNNVDLVCEYPRQKVTLDIMFIIYISLFLND